MPLYDWQQATADRQLAILQRHPVALNTSDTGTGKTYMALDSLIRLNRRALVLCPKATISAWHRAANVMSCPERLLDVINPERLIAKVNHTAWYVDKKWRLPLDGMIVWDEVHRGTQGSTTQIGEALARSKAWRVPLLAQSATVADSPTKMRSLGFLLGCHDYSEGSFRQWCLRKGCRWQDLKLVIPKDKGVEVMSAVRQEIGDRMVRLQIADIPGFPETVLETQLIDLDEKYREEVNKIYAEMEDRLKQRRHHALALLQQARERTERFKQPAIVELTKSLIEEGRSVVIMVWYRETVFQLAKALMGWAPAVIIGEQPLTERNAHVARFQSNQTPVCICTVGAGGTGIDLHDVEHARPRVALHTPGWSAIETKQALGRVHRAGGTPSLQIFLLAAETIEERVYQAVTQKLQNIAALNDADLGLPEEPT